MVEYPLASLLEKAYEHIGRLQMERHLSSSDVDEVVEECMDALPKPRFWGTGVTDENLRRAVRRHLQENLTIRAEKGEVLSRTEGGDWLRWLQEGQRLDGKPIEWDMWSAYEQYLRTRQPQPLPQAVVDALRASTLETLERLVDPLQEQDRWTCKGLVFGNVQSGKTGHYTGLISRAIDAGYKNVIVLAGLTNDLRLQTQGRLDEELVGKDTRPNTPPEAIGVGKIRNGAKKVQPWTYADRIKGDFSAARRNQLAAQLDLEDLETPRLAVIKKNRTALDNVAKLLRDVLENHPEVRSRPTLVIDDECDQASVDATKGDPKDANKRISAVNKSIRQLLRVFPRVTYVGYTATPFANVFIYPDAFSSEVGADLYPEDFVVALDPPDNYMGPTQVFGNELTLDPEVADGPTWGVVRKVNDHDELVKALKERSSDLHRPSSLEDAVMSFVLSTFLRRGRHARDQKPGIVHCGMLVQAIQFKQGHAGMASLIQEITEDLKQDLRDGPDSPLGRRLIDRFDRDYVAGPARKKFPGNWLPAEIADRDSWTELIEIVNAIEIKVINSDTEHVLQYSEETPPTIAVGGDKLSRGFTIEGLLVTYFLRNTMTEDTLLQMGRWFGYRNGWQDLVRTFLPVDMVRNFQKSAKSMEELRATFHQLNEDGKTPRDWAARVYLHPDTPSLWPTALAKRRNAAVVRRGLEGSRVETTSFDTSDSTAEHNRREFARVVTALAQRGAVRRDANATLIADLSVSDLDEFFNSRLKFHKRNPPSVHPELLREYIRLKNEIGELTKWTVVLPHNNRDSPMAVPAIGDRFGPMVRSVGKKGAQEGDWVRISVFSEPSDAKYGMDEALLQAARDHAKKADGANKKLEYQYIMEHRPVEHGVLILAFVEPGEHWKTGANHMHLGYIAILPGSRVRDARDYLITTKVLEGGGDD